jgi:DNA polymerase-1
MGSKTARKPKPSLDAVPLLDLSKIVLPEKGALKVTTKTSKAISEKVLAARNRIQDSGGLPKNYHVVDDVKTLGQISRAIATTKRFSFDTETSGLNPWKNELYCVSIKVDGHCYLINFEHPLLPRIPKDVFAQQLGEYFLDDTVRKNSFNICFDAAMLQVQANVACGYLHDDPGAALWVLDEEYIGGKTHPGLKDCCEHYLGFDAGGAYDEQFGLTAWIAIDPLVASYYAMKDADLHDDLLVYVNNELLKYPTLDKIYRDMDIPVLNILFKTTLRGLPVDIEHLPKLGAQLDIEIDELRCELDALCKNLGQEPPNWTSNEEVADLFYTRLKLPKRQGKGDSVDAKALTFLSGKTPIIEPLKKFRAKVKLKSGFVTAVQELIVDGLIHPSFRSTGSMTGRGTCNFPNLYNMPQKGEGIEIRKAYLAPEGYYIVSLDFQGQELRIQAENAADRVLINILLGGGDIYSETAALYHGGTAADYTKHGENSKKRDQAKIVVLALSYGAQAGQVASVFGCSKTRGQQFIDDFYRRFSGLKHWQDRTIDFAKKNGYVETICGRRRHLNFKKPDLETWQIHEMERAAINAPNQGSAADQTKLAIIKCDQHFKQKGYQSLVLFPIHDEILFAIKKEEFHESTIIQEIQYIMCNVLPVKHIQFTTSVEVYAERWGAVTEFKSTVPSPEEEEVAA